MENNFEALKNMGFDLLRMSFGAVAEMYKMEPQLIKRFQVEIIRKSFKFHYENNAFYRKICEESGVKPEEIRSFPDLHKIPLVPVKMFKSVDSHKLMTKSLVDVELELRSTGTSGIPSLARRDSETVTNAVVGIYSMYREFFKISNGAGLYLTPSSREMPEQAMAKSLNMFAGLLDTSECVVQNARFRPTDAIEVIKKWEGKFTRHIVGPPFLVYRLISYLKRHDIRLKLDKNTMVINVGGWKRYTGDEIPRDIYNKECAEYLGIQENQIRDFYGLVEANLVAVECEHHAKHVPPWIHCSVRDLKNLDVEVEEGKRGVLAIYDPSSEAYPGFIMTEDMVYLQKGDCACGRKGQRLIFVSRVPGAEVGCCAINLERYMDEMEKVH